MFVNKLKTNRKIFDAFALKKKELKINTCHLWRQLPPFSIIFYSFTLNKNHQPQDDQEKKLLFSSKIIFILYEFILVNNAFHSSIFAAFLVTSICEITRSKCWEEDQSLRNSYSLFSVKLKTRCLRYHSTTMLTSSTMSSTRRGWSWASAGSLVLPVQMRGDLLQYMTWDTGELSQSEQSILILWLINQSQSSYAWELWWRAGDCQDWVCSGVAERKWFRGKWDSMMDELLKSLMTWEKTTFKHWIMTLNSKKNNFRASWTTLSSGTSSCLEPRTSLRFLILKAESPALLTMWLMTRCSTGSWALIQTVLRAMILTALLQTLAPCSTPLETTPSLTVLNTEVNHEDCFKIQIPLQASRATCMRLTGTLLSGMLMFMSSTTGQTLTTGAALQVQILWQR